MNVSEGRRQAVVDEIRAAARRHAAVLDVHTDQDHNRSVVTLGGPPGGLVDAVLALAAVAVERVDLGRHEGVHPRLGAVDVVPFVPLRSAGLDEAAAAALVCGRRLWDELAVPSFLYESASPSRRSLPEVRAGAFTSIRPDIGGPGPHPTAGAAVVGARQLLVAYNLDLTTRDPAVARRIAAAVRERDGGLPGVRAMGLFLESRAGSQVSMNLTRPATTTMATAFDAVAEAARAEGTGVRRGELVGLAPRAALGGRDWRALGLEGPAPILEEVLELTFGEG